MGKTSSIQRFGIFFSFFPENGDNLHEISKPISW